MKPMWFAVPLLALLVTACSQIPYKAPDFQAFRHKETGPILNIYWNYEHPKGDETLVKGYVRNLQTEFIYDFTLEVASLDDKGKVIAKKFFYAFPQRIGTITGADDADLLPFQVRLRDTGREKAYRFCYQFQYPIENDNNPDSRSFIGAAVVRPAELLSWCFTDKLSR